MRATVFNKTYQDRTFRAVILLRIGAGLVFILAGLRKFIEPAEMGAGRFAEMGLPAAGFLGPFVGMFELLGGIGVLLGLYTRLAAVPLAVTMIFAIWLTKVPVFADNGLIAGAHSIRLDGLLLLACIYLIYAGSGTYALDRKFSKK